MPTTIKLRNSVTTTSAPSSLVQGEVAINITDKKVWVGNAATTPIQLLGDGGSASFTSIAFGAGTVSNPSITFTGDTNTGIYSPAADTIAFTEGGVEAMRIDSSGNVGIGTSSPARRIDARSTSSDYQYRAGDSANPVLSYDFGRENTAGLFKFYGNQTGATGYIFDGVDGERMRITTTGNVGIGTSSPARTLDVNGNMRLGTANGRFIEILNASSEAAYISQESSAELRINQSTSGANSKIAFLTQGSERMRITSDGNVGIGTSSPTVRLSVYNTAVGNTNQFRVGFSDLFAWDISRDNANTGALTFSNANNAAFVERMRIDSSGNVGIGTSSPTSFSGYTVVDAYNGTTGAFFLVRNPTKTGQFTVDTNGVRIGSRTNDFLALTTNDTERMRISSNGYVSINTTGTVIAGANNHLSIVATNIFNTAYAIGLRNLGTTTGGFFVNFANSSDTSIGSISQNTTTSVAYNTTSDYRLKENVTPMTGALAKVAQLKPCTFTWKSTGEASQGFIAHELQAVVPDCVTGEKDAVDDNGNPRYQGVDTSFLVATLTAAIQEQQAMIEELKQEVAKLKGV